MTAAKLYAANQLLKNRLVRFGMSEADASKVATECRFRHLNLRQFNFTGLRLAEHVARCWANWDRCYHVDTTRLAMGAR